MNTSYGLSKSSLPSSYTKYLKDGFEYIQIYMVLLYIRNIRHKIKIIIQIKLIGKTTIMAILLSKQNLEVSDISMTFFISSLEHSKKMSLLSWTSADPIVLFTKWNKFFESQLQWYGLNPIQILDKFTIFENRPSLIFVSRLWSILSCFRLRGSGKSLRDNSVKLLWDKINRFSFW